MKPLDLTKPLQTCHGEKAEFVYDGLSGDYPLVVVVHSHDGKTTLRTYTREGGFYRGKGSLGSLENVPERRESWVNIYPDNTPSAHSTRERADAYARHDRIACVRVEYEEGEGL